MKKPLMLLILILGLGSRFSYADWDGHHWGHHGTHAYLRYHNHPRFGYRVHDFYPDEYYPVVIGGARYYYDDGVYYNYLGGQYEVVQPPVGAVVSTIPSDFQPVVVHGVTYYRDANNYYIHTPQGYEVVAPPR